jgi:hypothetical protein
MRRRSGVRGEAAVACRGLAAPRTMLPMRRPLVGLMTPTQGAGRGRQVWAARCNVSIVTLPRARLHQRHCRLCQTRESHRYAGKVADADVRTERQPSRGEPRRGGGSAEGGVRTVADRACGAGAASRPGAGTCCGVTGGGDSRSNAMTSIDGSAMMGARRCRGRRWPSMKCVTELQLRPLY